MKKLTLAVAILAFGSAAHAGNLSIVNPGFESLDLVDGDFTFTIPGWSVEGDTGTFDPSPRSYPNGLVPEGDNVAYSNSSGTWISQVLTATVEASTKYELSVYVGRRLDLLIPGYVIELRAGGQLLAADNGSLLPGAGSFLKSTVSYTSGQNDSAVGKPIEIRFQPLGRQANFDAVSLMASPVPEVDTLPLFGAGFLALVLYRKGTR